MRSANEEFTQLPIHTCLIGSSPTSLTDFTLSGLDGVAISGSRVSRSITISLSYSAPGSGFNSAQSFSRPCALKKARVCSSEGNIEDVAPSSAPILVIVALSGRVRLLIPSPPYSNTFPTPPFTVCCLSTSRIMSFALTPARSFPCSFTWTTSGITSQKGSPAIASATLRPPAPIASIPAAPAFGVWLSDPRSVCPGLENLSRCT